MKPAAVPPRAGAHSFSAPDRMLHGQGTPPFTEFEEVACNEQPGFQPGLSGPFPQPFLALHHYTLICGVLGSEFQEPQ